MCSQRTALQLQLADVAAEAAASGDLPLWLLEKVSLSAVVSCAAEAAAQAAAIKGGRSPYGGSRKPLFEVEREAMDARQRQGHDAGAGARQVLGQPRVAEGVATAAAATLEAIRIAGEEATTTLCLRGEAIGDDGAKLLGIMLRTNATVTEMDLRSCAIGKEGVNALAEGLSKNVTVTMVLLGGNPMENDDASSPLQINGEGGWTTNRSGANRRPAATTLFAVLPMPSSRKRVRDEARQQCDYMKRNEQQCTLNGIHDGRCNNHRECKEVGCNKTAAGSTDFCKAHGGGRPR